MDDTNDDVVKSLFMGFQVRLVSRLVLAAFHSADDDWQFLFRLLILRHRLVVGWW